MAGAYVLVLQLGDLTIDLNDTDANGFVIESIDPGYAAPRAVVTDLPGQDGQRDDTAYFSTRTVQLTGAVVPTLAGASRTKAKDALAPFLAPNARPQLLYAFDEDTDTRSLTLRVGQWSNPIDHPVNATAFSVQFVCPDPISYGLLQREITVPLAAGAATGRAYPRTYPRAYSSAVPVDVAVATAGTYPTWPLVRIYGPCQDPALTWVDPTTGAPIGVQVVFDGLTIADGDYVEVDTRARTAVEDGDPMANRYNFVDFSSTVWGPLQPGSNKLRFTASSTGTDCTCVVFWYDAFLD